MVYLCVQFALLYFLYICKSIVWCNLLLFIKLLIVSGNQQDLSSVKSEDLGNVQEMSTKNLIVGSLNLRLDSSAVHRIMKMIVCALEHEYEPYSRTKPGLLLLHIYKYTELNQTEFCALEGGTCK